MAQNELLEQAKNYINYNLNDEKKLELVTNILEDLSNDAFENGYNKQANTLTTVVLTLRELLESER